MNIQLTIYISNDYTIDYVHRQMIIQLTIHLAKWIYNRLYTYTNDYIIDYTRSQMTMYIVKWLYNWLYTAKWQYNRLYT